MKEKIKLGQFYTRTSPFELTRFQKWLSSIPSFEKLSFIEPFAGSNSIVKLMHNSTGIPFRNWTAYDIDPAAQEANLVPQVQILHLDTIKNFPAGFDICITNPPYLAKNSATRKGMDLNFEGYQDIYEIALERMLSKCAWVAAIIPESFLTRKIHRTRLEFVISLNVDMFQDTDFPVCLAVFSPKATETYEIWRGDEFLGTDMQLREVSRNFLTSSPELNLKFNDPSGPLGLWAIDNTREDSIRFLDGSTIDPAKIKVSSRAITRISSSVFSSEEVLMTIIAKSNELLAGYRDQTQDVFMTSFKGLRSDGRYRRRIDWATASGILDKAASELGILKTPNSPRLF